MVENCVEWLWPNNVLAMRQHRRHWLIVGTVLGRMHGNERGSQQTRDVDPMLLWCWATVFDAGPTSHQHWINVPCLLGCLNHTLLDWEGGQIRVDFSQLSSKLPLMSAAIKTSLANPHCIYFKLKSIFLKSEISAGRVYFTYKSNYLLPK